MRTLLVLLVLQFVAACSCLSLPRHHDLDYSEDNEIDIDDDNLCQLRLYKVQRYQGKPTIISQSRKKLRGMDKSLQMIGHCCWALYGQPGFKGRPTLMGGALSVASTYKWGFRRTGVRSAKRLESCTDAR